MDVQLKDAVSAFFVEFSKFSNLAVSLALRSLSKDPVFVEHAEQLLDLEARLKLIERMAFARNVPATLIAELEACLVRARILLDQHDEVERTFRTADGNGGGSLRSPATTRRPRRRNAELARLVELENVGMPALERVHEYTQEAVQLQAALRAVTEKFEVHLADGRT
jgi:hypothetical protein